MPTVTRPRTPKAPPKPDTLADVLKALGDIPPSRILWTPFPGTATEADLLTSRKRVELIDNILVRRSLSFAKGTMQALVSYHLGSFAHINGLLASMGGPYRLSPTIVRCPDVSVVSPDRVFGGESRWPEVAPTAPKLIADIPTEENTSRELERKVTDYFKGGTQLIWVFSRSERTVVVYTNQNTCYTLSEEDTLTGGAVLPGFALNLADFFNDPQVTLTKPTNRS